MNAPHELSPRLARRPLPAAMLQALRARFGERCSSATAVCEQHGRDESPYPTTPPDAVVFCESTEDVAAVVRLADEHAVPVIPFGVGSSLEGHLLAVQGGVSVDLSRMTAIVQLNAEDLTVTVQAGVTREQLNREVRDLGLFFPIDPGANATLGGMAATRASGTNAVRYGTMRENVLGADGRHRRRRGHPHRHAGEEEQRRLRPDAPVRGQRRHAGRDDRGHAQALPAARGGERGDLPLRQHRRRRARHHPGHPDGRAHRALRTARRERGARRQCAEPARPA